MTRVRRLQAVGAVLALVAAITSSHVWGEAGTKVPDKLITSGSKTAPDNETLAEDLAKSKFDKDQAITYRTKNGDTIFALGLKPRLDPSPPRPRDILVMVDTSASQVGGPLKTAQMIADDLVARANPDDRIALWTVNTPSATRDLTNGFQPPTLVENALKELKQEVPLGDTDLKNGLEKALKTFGGGDDRQRLVLFLGDGMSIHNPLTSTERTRFCQDMVGNQVAFFAVPLGPQVDPYNLHGLASGTGGVAVRLYPTDKTSEVIKRLSELIAAPILYPTSFQLPAEVTEYFPAKLPPLRGDAPTLVIGHVKPGETLAYSVDGTVAGRNVTVRTSLPVVSPELDNFFLVGMLDQWKNDKESPAIMPAGRALAFAQELNEIARSELLAQGQLALAHDHFDAAARLFGQVQALDPSDSEADGGLKLTGMLRDGKVKKDQLRQQFAKMDREAIKIEPTGLGHARVQRDQLKNLLAQVPDAEKPAPAAVPPVPEGAPPELVDPLKQQQQRIAIADQRATQTVEDSIRQARRSIGSDPDGAKELLKRVLAGIRDDTDLSDRTRQNLINRLEENLRNIETQGAVVKRDQEQRLRQLALARERFETETKRLETEERTKERMRAFHSLMDQARYSDAYKQALAIAQDAIEQGAPVPVAVTGAYDVGLVSSNLRTLQEFRRVREERYLLTMLEVERSFVPFPDDPPVWFPKPPFSKIDWHTLTTLRKEKYESSGLMDEDPATLRKVREMRQKLNEPVSVSFEPNTPLKDALEHVSDRYNITILINSEAFKAEGVNEVESTGVQLPKLTGVSLGTVLRLLTAKAGGTYIVRRDFVEVTTNSASSAEKVLRVFPVADLVIPIPNSVNQQGLQQNLSLLGGTVNAGTGAQLGALGGGLGALGALGALGGALGALGGQLGALGALGAAGAGGLGLAGGGLAGGAGGGFGGGGLGFAGQGAVNNGVGGGFSGFGGGQLGQFGNLGGQFGLQGGDQSAILIKLITQVVGTPDEWLPPNPFNNGGVGGLAGDPNDPGTAANPKEANSLGYYPAARCLLVKGTSRTHTSMTGGVLAPRAGVPPAAGMGALDVQRPGAIVIAPRDPNRVQVANAGDQRKDNDPTVKAGPPKVKPTEVVADLDAKKVWQDALARGVKDPGLIIATADFLAEHKKFDHAAEFLKANLRQGIVSDPWVYDALSIALKESKGSLEEIERAQLSAVDRQPQNAEGYLKAAHAVVDADKKLYSRAVAFCRQASLLEPNASRPYEEALLYAEMGKDTDAMQWAAGNLLSRAWPAENDQIHNQAEGKLETLAGLLEKDNRKDEATKMMASVATKKERDLVIQLSWQGDADLDLEVKEPVGTVCSFMQRQTPGGGTLIGDTLADTSHESYVAAQAFSGQYEIMVRRIWGRSLGGRATVKIIRHQGTPQENISQETVVIEDRSSTVKLTLADGWRTTLAQVAPPAANQRPLSESENAVGGDRVLNKLRALADPELASAPTGIRGGFGSLGSAATPDLSAASAGKAAGEQMALQTKVSPMVTNSMDFSLQGKVSADRRYMRLSMTPVYQTLNMGPSTPVMANPLIPGVPQSPTPR